MCCSVYCTEMEAKEETARAERQLQILVKYSHPRCTHAFIWRKNKPKAGLSLSFSFSTQIRSPPRRLITKTNPTSVFFFFFSKAASTNSGISNRAVHRGGNHCSVRGDAGTNSQGHVCEATDKSLRLRSGCHVFVPDRYTGVPGHPRQ